jgi:hypothetical protein
MASSSGLPFPHPRRLPTHAEAQQYKAIIADMDKDIKNIEIQMEKLNEQLQDLKRKRANHVSFLAPFRRLPAEILCKIGVLCLHNEDSITTITSIHNNLRSAMIGMPSLWRRIRLTARPWDDDDVNFYEEDDDNDEEVEGDEDNVSNEDDNNEAAFTYDFSVSPMGEEFSLSYGFLDHTVGTDWLLLGKDT